MKSVNYIVKHVGKPNQRVKYSARHKRAGVFNHVVVPFQVFAKRGKDKITSTKNEGLSPSIKVFRENI